MAYRGMSKKMIKKNIKLLSKIYGKDLTDEEIENGLDEVISNKEESK